MPSRVAASSRPRAQPRIVTVSGFVAVVPAALRSSAVKT